jgi:hypothetical protein
MMIAHRGIVSRFFYSEYCQYEHPLSGSAWHRSLDLDDNGDYSGRVGTLSENAGLIFPVGTMKSAGPAFRHIPSHPLSKRQSLGFSFMSSQMLDTDH